MTNKVIPFKFSFTYFELISDFGHICYKYLICICRYIFTTIYTLHHRYVDVHDFQAVNYRN